MRKMAWPPVTGTLTILVGRNRVDIAPRLARRARRYAGLAARAA